MDTLDPTPPAPIWTIPPDAAIRALGSHDGGLLPDEAGRRLAEAGPNRLPEKKGRSPVLLFLEQFRSFLNLLLVGAAILAGIVGDLTDAIVIGGVVLFNAVLGFFQEHRAEKAVAALGRMLPRTATVRRGGRVEEIPADDLVPGDIVLLEAGDRIPADGRLLVAQNLEVDESSLTGESTPVDKRVPALTDRELPVGDRVNLGFMNTTVTRGRAELLVTATGPTTEMGRLAASLAGTGESETPLQRQVDALGRRLAAIAGVVVVVIALVNLLRGMSLVDLLLGAVAIAVAAIPEGLPAVVTVTLALGMGRMARQNAIVRRMSAVETLGCTTDICSDKTGTLTVNQMTARCVHFLGHAVEVTGEGYDPSDGAVIGEDPRLALFLRGAALCNDSAVRDGAVMGDPTEGALVVLATKGGVDVDALRRALPRVAEVPFEAERKFSATAHPDGAVFVKGAPDVLLERCVAVLDERGAPCALDQAERDRVADANDAMSARGLRVLAIAARQGDPDAIPRDPDALADDLRDLVLVGLVGLLDPPRSEARDAIAACRRAGVSVRMITGDHARTGLAIARTLGIEGDAVSGRELDGMDDAALREALPRIGVFARVSPEHKLRIVSALQEERRVVAMIGDGVNDAPALRRADIGVAMGITGTEVSREAANLVLADDNFATVVQAVREGRTIYDNIVRFLRFQLSTNLGALLTLFFAPVLALPSPFTPLQILWVNVIMDGPPAMALGVDPPREDVMDQPPRDPDERLLTGRRLLNLAWFGGIMAAGTLIVLAVANRRDPASASTLAFTTFVLFQVFNVWNARFERRSALGARSLVNPLLWAAIAGVVVLQVLVIHVGPLQRLFGTVALTPTEWGVAVAVAASVLVLEELRKAIVRNAG